LADDLPTGSGERPKAPKGARQLRALAEDALAPALKARGFASSEIHLRWAEIAGAHLAPWTEPVSLRWPPRAPGADPDKAKEGAALTVKVEGAFALDLQHQAPQVIQRVNAFFGWRCVERLVLKQGPVRKLDATKRRARPVLTVEASRRLDAALEGIEQDDLKKALARLGVGVLGTRE
jgi:hypothetical protein